MISTVVNNDKHSFEQFTDAFLSKSKKALKLDLSKVNSCSDEDHETYFGCGICMEDLAKSPRKCASCDIVNCRDCSITWKQQDKRNYCPQCNKAPWKQVGLSLYEKNRYNELLKMTPEEMAKLQPAEIQKARKMNDACPAGCGRRGLKSEADLQCHARICNRITLTCTCCAPPPPKMVLQADWYICKNQLNLITEKAQDLTRKAEDCMVSFYNTVSEMKGPELLANAISEACSQAVENLNRSFKSRDLFKELRQLSYT